jgi:hypothetical protein
MVPLLLISTQVKIFHSTKKGILTEASSTVGQKAFEAVKDIVLA